MTDWHTVQEALAAALDDVSIEVDLGADDPFTQAIAAVFVDPPASIEPGELPAIVLGDDAFEDEWDSNLAREHYEQEAWLLLRDEDAAVAIHLCKAYRQGIKAALRANAKLGLSPVILTGARFGGMGVINYAGESYLGFRFTTGITVHDTAPGFAAG